MPDTTPGKRMATKLLKGLIALEILVVVLGLTLWLYPQSVPAALALAGRKSMCPLEDVWTGGELRIQLNAKIAQIRSESRMIEEDPSGYELWETPEGNWWIPAGSESSLPVLLGQQAVNQYGDGERTVQKGDIVLDGGAHIGVWVREALDRGAGLVVAIEPAPVNVECLRRNLAAEIADGRVIVYPKGIWHEVAELPLFEDPKNSAADSFVAHSDDVGAARTLPLVPIDLLVEELELARVDLIKMDIKGAVTRALEGAQGTLAKDEPKLIIATEEEDDDPYDVFAALEKIHPGYQVNCSGCSVVEGWQLWPDVLLLSKK